MIGPLEDALVDLARRQRCNWIVSTLRIGTRFGCFASSIRSSTSRASRRGGFQATFRPTDLAALTAEIASGFRSAIERAGLRFMVEVSPLARPVYADRDMWEKIVLNLLSNAFKFTWEGEIEVSLREVDGRAQLTVRDTGVGIPDDELPKLFERFHRVEGAHGRSFEGSGIGLALVYELVRQHGGKISVESAVGRGTIFTVAVPFGATHLPARSHRSCGRRYRGAGEGEFVR